MTADPPSQWIAPPAALLSGAPAAVLAALPGARAVGGLVRDILAGHPLADVDVAAPFPPETITERLRAAGLRVFETGVSHGTVTAVLDRQPVEVTALRQDIATDGRHAEVAWTTDWRIDAARRDFSINAMSLAADGRLWDYFGGREDLAAGRVRFVGDPATRLAEDYLRALRFFRFQARYGRGAPDAAAIAAITAAVPGLARLSAERVWSELKRLLVAPDPCDSLALMACCGVLGAVLPEVVEDGTIPRLPRLRRLVAITPRTDPVLRLAALLGEVTPRGLGGLAGRLRLSGEERGRLSRFCGPRPDMRPEPGLDADAARRLLALLGAEEAEAELLLAEAEDGQDRSADRALLAETPVPVFPLLGQDVLDLGVPEGPRIGRLYNSVRGWWFAGGCVADKAALLARLSEEVAAG